MLKLLLRISARKQVTTAGQNSKTAPWKPIFYSKIMMCATFFDKKLRAWPFKVDEEKLVKQTRHFKTLVFCIFFLFFASLGDLLTIINI